MKLNNDDLYGIAGSVLFHLVIGLILAFTVLHSVMPEEDGGVLVNFGNVNSAAGTFEPKFTGVEPPQETTTPPPPAPATAPRVETVKEELVTQDLEETVALENKKKKKEKEKKESEAKKKQEQAEKERLQREQAERDKRAKEEAEKKRLAEEQRKKQAISNKVAGAFGIGSAAGTSQGDAAVGTGNQGNPFGNSDHGAMEGVGGMGSFSLSNRKLITGRLAEPSYNENKEGKIVIDITVDTKGNVIRADIGKGTTIEDVSMRQKAIAAAKRNKFNEISGVNNQSGTITYVYRLN